MAWRGTCEGTRRVAEAMPDGPPAHTRGRSAGEEPASRLAIGSAGADAGDAFEKSNSILVGHIVPDRFTDQLKRVVGFDQCAPADWNFGFAKKFLRIGLPKLVGTFRRCW